MKMADFNINDTKINNFLWMIKS